MKNYNLAITSKTDFAAEEAITYFNVGGNELGKLADKSNITKLQFYNVDDVVDILGVSRPKAYAIMRELNLELMEKGFIVVSGKVSARFFNEKLYIGIVC